MASGNGKLTGAVDANEFLARYDIPKKIYEKLPLLEGKVIGDADFRSSLAVDTARWARAREREEFSNYILEIRGRLYWGKPDTLAALKDKLDVV